MKFGEELQQKKSECVNNDSNIGIIILSRYSSRRLPGKALLEIEGKKILKYIIERLLQVINIDNIIIATSNESSDNPIAEFAKTEKIQCYRGSLDNVSKRFYEAANRNNWKYAIRINGDNIFVDTKVLEEMIAIAKTNNYNFITNVKDRTFPKGMSIEIVDIEYYKKRLSDINEHNNYQEHVTLHLYELYNTNDDFYFFKNTAFPEAAGIQLALDTKEDFERTQKIISKFTNPHYLNNLEDILNTLKNE